MSVSPPAADAPNDSATESKRKSIRGTRRKILLVVFWLFVIGGLNWPYAYTAVNQVTTGTVGSVVDFEVELPQPPRMAGWPYRYWVSYESPVGHGSKVSRFSFFAFCIDVFLVMTVATLLFAYSAFSKRRQETAAVKSTKRTSISIADILVAMLVLASVFSWWRYLDSRSTAFAEFVARLSDRGGNVTTNVWVPTIVSRVWPPALGQRMQQCRQVRIEYPDTATVQEIVSQPELQSLRLGGGEYDLKLLEAKVSSPHLVDLRLAGRELDIRTFQTIHSMPRLRALNLDRTNVNADVLNRLNHLPELEHLSFVHSDVVWSELGSPPDAHPAWVQTIRQLRLGHPLPGEHAELRIANWPKLQSLVINELESQVNATAMKVELIDMPALNYLGLDGFQKFDLTLHNVPQLPQISGELFEWKDRLPRNTGVPSALWCNRLDVDGAGELSQLELDARSLEYLRLKNVPKLKNFKVIAQDLRLTGETRLPELSAKATTTLIEGLGKSSGPQMVDFGGISLAGVDLVPLVKNQLLTGLRLAGSGVTSDQLKSLKSMEQLNRLSLDAGTADDEMIGWTLDAFPELSHLELASPADLHNGDFFIRGFQFGTFAASGMGTLTIVDRPNLRTLTIADFAMRAIGSVRITGSPQINSALSLGFIKRLELSDAPSLRGLSVQGPLPKDAQLNGFRDLIFFAVGGPGVTDATLAALQDCQTLQTVTLAYPAVTGEGLKSIPVTAQMTSIAVPGTPLDDSIVLSWPPLPSITHLNLRDTQVSGQSVAHLCTPASIRSLILDGTNVAPEGLDCLTNCRELRELSLRGIDINPDTLNAILRVGRLRVLDLSGTKLSEAHMDAIIQSGSSLEWIGLQDAEFKESKLLELLIQRKNLFLEVDPLSLSTKLSTQLIPTGRILQLQQWWSQQTSQTSSNTELIDVELFADLANRVLLQGTSKAPQP